MSSLADTFVTKAYDKKGGKMDYGNGKKKMPMKPSTSKGKKAMPAKPSTSAGQKKMPAKKAAPMSAAKKAARPMQSSTAKPMPKKPAMPRMGDRKVAGTVMKQWDGRRWVTVG